MNSYKETLMHVWEKWSTLSNEEFDTWLHTEMHKPAGCDKHVVSGKRLLDEQIVKEMRIGLDKLNDCYVKISAACASGAVDTVAERRFKYCEWCQLETPIEDNKCSECGKPCAEVH